jgi:opacity protein-like surface antigen
MKRTIMAAALILVAIAANAQDEDEDHPRFRAGFLANFTDYDGDDTFPVADSALGLQLYAQGQVSSNFAVEVGYFNSGGFETDLSPNTSPGSCQVQDFCDTELSLNGFSISAVGYLPIGGDDNAIDLFGKIGGYDFDIDISQTVSNSTLPGSLGHSTGFTLGIGAVFNLGENFGVRTGADYFDIDNADLWSLSMGLEYHF